MLREAGGIVSHKAGVVSVGWNLWEAFSEKWDFLSSEGCTPSGEVEVSLFVASDGPCERKDLGKQERGTFGIKNIQVVECWVVIMLSTISDLKLQKCYLMDWIFRSFLSVIWEKWLLKMRWRPDLEEWDWQAGCLLYALSLVGGEGALKTWPWEWWQVT